MIFYNYNLDRNLDIVKIKLKSVILFFLFGHLIIKAITKLISGRVENGKRKDLYEINRDIRKRLDK